MKIHFVLLVSLSTAALALGACTTPPESTQVLSLDPVESPTPMPPSPEVAAEPTTAPTAGSPGQTTFTQLGISLEIPEGLTVIKDPIINLDDPSRLQSYTFYIQDYGPDEGPGEEYFQIYGHLQFDLPPTVWEEYKTNILSSDMYKYAREIKVNNLPGIDSQIAGQRNRYVYHFPLDGKVLTLSISEPNEKNKILADQIINTLKFSPGRVTDTSGVQLINEPAGYYQLYLPADWTFNFNPPAGIRVSDLQTSSPDAEVVIEETDGPHSNIYYKNGITLNIAILEDDSALRSPVMAQIASQTPIMISGIAGEQYVFTEPSTMEGEILEVRYYHNQLSYLVRFSYAPGTDQQQLDWLIRNFQINP